MNCGIIPEKLSAEIGHELYMQAFIRDDMKELNALRITTRLDSWRRKAQSLEQENEKMKNILSSLAEDWECKEDDYWDNYQPQIQEPGK